MQPDLTELENRLWDAADELRANSGLKASEYSSPVLGLIFLRRQTSWVHRDLLLLPRDCGGEMHGRSWSSRDAAARAPGDTERENVAQEPGSGLAAV